MCPHLQEKGLPERALQAPPPPPPQHRHWLFLKTVAPGALEPAAANARLEVANAFRQWTSGECVALKDPVTGCARGNVLIQCRTDSLQARTSPICLLCM